MFFRVLRAEKGRTNQDIKGIVVTVVLTSPLGLVSIAHYRTVVPRQKIETKTPKLTLHTRDDHGGVVPEWTPAGVCILGWSWSQYFRFEPEQELESTLRSVQEPIKSFKGPDFCNDACCQTEWNELRQTEMKCFLTSVVIYHKRLTLGGSTEHFTTNDGFKVMAYAKYSV